MMDHNGGSENQSDGNNGLWSVPVLETSMVHLG